APIRSFLANVSQIRTLAK
ncbi:hypothetical protein D039_1183B, partial [Vibrio parahaemolyticus EKP-028]